MTAKEYIKTIEYNGQIILLGNDDYGQCYFLEWVDKDGIAHSTSCGTYCADYMEVIESYFGDATMCDKFSTTERCEEWLNHGYCFKCPKSELVQDREKRLRNK